MKVELPYADGTLTATLPEDARRLSTEGERALPPLADLDSAVRAALKLAPKEKLAGFVYIGTAKEQQSDRERPDLAKITSRWIG